MFARFLCFRTSCKTKEGVQTTNLFGTNSQCHVWGSVLKIANALMRVENEMKLKNKSSGLKRFARILGLAEKEEQFNLSS